MIKNPYLLISNWRKNLSIDINRQAFLSALSTVLIMALLGSILIGGGYWVKRAYGSDYIVIKDYIALTKLNDGIRYYMRAIQFLEKGEEQQAVDQIKKGKQAVGREISKTNFLVSISREDKVHIYTEALLTENAMRRVIGLKHYISAFSTEISPDEITNKQQKLNAYIKVLKLQAQNINKFMVSLRDRLYKRFKENNKRITYAIAILGPVGFLLILGVSIFSMFWLARTIRLITLTFTQLNYISDIASRGDYSIRLPNAKSRDISFLFQCFNNMMQNLEDHFNRQSESAREMEILAYQDPLTKLHNRTKFSILLDEIILDRRMCTKKHALMFLDIDRFKEVNDTYGHQIGDGLIKAFSMRITECLREQDVVARMGGDEFAIILPEIEQPCVVENIACRIIESLRIPFNIGGLALDISASIGIAIYPTDDVSKNELLRKADLAMFNAKNCGRSRFAFYSDDLNHQVQERMRLGAILRSALHNRQFSIHYQPKVNTDTGVIIGAEALLRWHCPQEGVVSPDRFIPILEDTGMIDEVGYWVIREACLWVSHYEELHVAVNVATRQLFDQQFSLNIKNILADTGISSSRLELEITESMIMEDTEAIMENLELLQQLGVSLALDDFGTGYSSLSYLQRFRTNVLKLDRSFILGIEDVGAAVVAGVISMAHGLNMTVVAEGVESEEQLIVLRTLGCDIIQGYLISKPITIEVFQDFVQNYQPSPKLFGMSPNVSMIL